MNVDHSFERALRGFPNPSSPTRCKTAERTGIPISTNRSRVGWKTPHVQEGGPPPVRERVLGRGWAFD